jgi:metallo-beta-lactamase class B VIM
MLKRSLLIAAFVLSACGGAEAPAPKIEKPADNFLTQLQTDYPVTLSKIADNVWVHTTNYNLPGQSPIPVNGLVVVDGDEVILVDGAWGELATLSLLEKVKSETGKMPSKMIVTHHHADRTAGVDAAEWRGLQIFTHPDTPQLAARAGFPAPDTSVAALKDPKSRTKVGSLEIAYPGHGHAQDNLVVYIPSAGVLYAGCAVRGAGVKTLGNTEDANLAKWAESLKWVKATYPKATVVVPGHGKGANLSLIDATFTMISAEIAEADAAP